MRLAASASPRRRAKLDREAGCCYPAPRTRASRDMTQNAPAHLFDTINLRRKGWLTVLIREALETPLVPEPPTLPTAPLDSFPAFEAWGLERMRALGFYFGTALVMDPSREGLGQHILLETLARQVQLLAEVRRAMGEPVVENLLPLEIATTLGLAQSSFTAAEALRDLRLDLHDGVEIPTRRMSWLLRAPMRAIGDAYKQTLLADDHPLLDSSFHRLLIYCDTRLLLQLAWDVFTAGRFREARCLRYLGENHLQKLYFVEAIIGLSWANGAIDPMEYRLVRELIDIGHFSPEERRLLWRCLDGDPPTPDEIAEGVIDPVNRRFLLEQVLFASMVDGELSPEEDSFVRALAQTFQMDHGALAELELEALRHFERNPEVLQGLSTRGVLGRMRGHATRQVERVVRDNLQALLTEVRETGQLARLLLKAASDEDLTQEEFALVRDQLLDICKTIPSLALLAAPGGSVLVAVLIKVLPFSLLPSAFTDQDETF